MKMRSMYLILAAAAVVVTCEPQQSNNDIVWFPVDDEDGVFVSIYGEKRGAPRDANSRSHRRARYSGSIPPSLPFHESPLPLSYDPTENRDPSFFHNINERRPLISVPPIPKVPPSFQDQQFPVKRPNKWPQGQANPYESMQDIFNEVFDYNKYPPVSESSGSRPGTTNQWSNQWGNRPGTTSQWGNANQSSMQKPGIVWETTSRPPAERPNTSSQQGNYRPTRPGNSEWINTNRPSNRPTSQSDKLIFPGEISLTTTTTTTPSNLIPTDPPTMSPCERLCPVTPEFNPVCGTDGVTYTNHGRLKCANKCGKNVRLAHYGNCGRTSLVTPLISQTPKLKFKGFWVVDN